ncbi:FAD-dependent monooxygenase [Streptomyces sp. NPDC002766]|uniref:FAD-dependent monooxygenase n=1 Tax=Streptomyces sp. NPDC002766 TaxID=3154429 RepID=UPI00331EB1B2
MGHAGMDTDVLIAGAGPTGLMLACELRLAGADVVVAEQLPERTGESRAGGLHSRTLEVLDQRGVVDRFLAAGDLTPVGHFSGLWLDFDEFQSRHPLPLMILQSTIERLLEEWAAELGVRIRWSSEVTGLRQDEAGVTVELRTAERASTSLRARYLVGCDGGRSSVRRLSGVDFPGTPATMTALLGDVEIPDLPEDFIFMRRCPGGHFSALALEPGVHRVITSEYDRVADRDASVTFEQLRESLVRLAGTDYGMRNPRWISRFGDAARQAAKYREGRVLLAGDAAHIHYPAGGQGLNIGVQDAVNLGWKLAAVVRGRAPESLLDTYHTERHPVGERLLHNTRAQSALARPGAEMDALREVFGSLMVFDDVNRYLRDMITALDIRYAVDDDHPLAGRRVPDADLKTPEGAISVYELLHTAHPVLLDLSGGAGTTAAVAEGWADRVDLVEARSQDDHWPVPAVGDVPAPSALLIRPDGHVAWAADSGALDASALRTALTIWFGPALRR